MLGKYRIPELLRNTVSSKCRSQGLSLMTPSTDLDKTQLERKIRLLTLASLAFKHVGHDLPYSKAAEALQIDLEDVEKWAIDGNTTQHHTLC